MRSTVTQDKNLTHRYAHELPALDFSVYDAAEQRKAVRKRVLAHPELATRLTESPLCYARPEQWTGYIPPGTWDGQYNNAPEREALLAIVADLELAEAAQAVREITADE